MSKRMSHDRVHFTICERYLQKTTIRECIQETLGINIYETTKLARQHKDLSIICRPSQFARFVILRHVKYGEPNNMSCLNMKLVVPEPDNERPMDVSENPNTVKEGCP